MRNRSVKWQMGLVAALSVLGMLMLSVLQYYSMSSIDSLGNARALFNGIESGMLMLRRNEKDFLARKDAKYIEKFNDNHSAVQTQTNLLVDTLQENNLDSSIAERLTPILDDYQMKFLSMADLQQQIGLDSKAGLYGALRKAVHQAEDLLKAHKQDKLIKDMLMLRRREKDFMLRLDLKYLEKFEKDMVVLHQDLSESLISNAIREEVLAALKVYEADFKALVDANVKLGLTRTQGLLGEMRNTIHQSEVLLDELKTDTGQHINEAVIRLELISIAANTILILSIVGLIIYIVPGVTRPVGQLAKLMSDTSKNQDITIRADETGPQEIVSMARAFNRMMETFQKLVSEIGSSSQQLSVAAEEFEVVARTTNSAANMQQAETDQVATAMNEMSVTIQEVARHATSAANASETADEEAKSGHSVVEKNREGITALANEVKSTADVISDLSEESENIGTVLSVIRGIAEQTNLLALNAAIEAARAGEQGRGFAVVADEVRTLAQRSQESTHEIQTIVERLQQAAERAVSAMDKGKNRAHESVQRSELAAESLSAILKSVSVIKDMNLQIATAAEEQAAVSDEINRNIVNISDVTREATSNTGKTVKTGQSLTRMANQLGELVGQFKTANS